MSCKSFVIFLAVLFLKASGAFAQLKVVSPNGGETFRVGSRMTIQWSGVLATDVVTLEYSTDNGTTWNLITSSATGLQYTWLNLPNAVSGTCLIRATLNKSAAPTKLFLGGNGIYNNADFSSDGNFVLGASSDGYAYIWDSHSTTLLHKFQTQTAAGIKGLAALNWWGKFSPDGKTFATVSPTTDSNPSGNRVRIFDANSGTELHEWHIHDSTGPAYTSGRCEFSPDGTQIASTGEDSIDVFDIASEALLAKLAGFVFKSGIYQEFNIANTIAWRPDGSDILAGIANPSDSNPTYVRASPVTGDTIQTYHLKSKFPYPQVHGQVHYSPDGTKFIAATTDTAVRVWDVASGAILYKISPALLSSVDGVFSHDGKTIATIGLDSFFVVNGGYNVKLWNSSDGSYIGLAGSVGGVSQTIEFSPDDQRILIPGTTVNIILQISPGSIESDISDGTWSIVSNTGENIVVYTPYISANVGDFVDIPILIDDPGGAVAAGATQVTFDLHFNATMLEPLSPSPIGTIVGGDRVLSYTLPIVATDTVLGILHVQAALGNDSITTLAIVGPATNAPTVTATDSNGIFKLLDVCYADGPRLLNPNGVVSMNIPNNPALDNIQVALNLTEDGQTSLTLFDVCGRKAYTLLDAYVTHGSRSISIPAQGINPGVYYVTLQTPNQRIMQPMEVVR